MLGLICWMISPLLSAAFPATTTIVQAGAQIGNGEVIALQPATAIRIVSEASNGCSNCLRWMKDFIDGSRGFMFAKPFQDMWGFVLAGNNQDTWANITKFGGNAVNKDTFKYIVESIEADGWRQVRSSEIPSWIAKTSAFTVSSYNAFRYATLTAAKTNGSFFISVPASAFGPDGEKFFMADTIDN